MNTQEICKVLGETGCYFLSLLHCAKSDYSALSLFTLALSKDYVDRECFVKNPAMVMQLADGGKWDVRHEPAHYQPTRNEMEILRFERKTPGVTYAHFVVGDGFGRVAYDPLGDSRTVAEGELVSKRIVRKLT